MPKAIKFCEFCENIQQNVKIIAISFDESSEDLFVNLEKYIYDSASQKSLARTYLSVINPQKYDIGKLLHMVTSCCTEQKRCTVQIKQQ